MSAHASEGAATAAPKKSGSKKRRLWMIIGILFVLAFGGLLIGSRTDWWARFTSPEDGHAAGVRKIRDSINQAFIAGSEDIAKNIKSSKDVLDAPGRLDAVFKPLNDAHNSAIAKLDGSSIISGGGSGFANITFDPNRYVYPGRASEALPPLPTPLPDEAISGDVHTATIPAYVDRFELSVQPGQTIQITKVAGMAHLAPGNFSYVNAGGGKLPTELTPAELPQEYPYPNMRVGALFLEDGSDRMTLTQPITVTAKTDKVAFGIHLRSVKRADQPTGSFTVQYTIQNP